MLAIIKNLIKKILDHSNNISYPYKVFGIFGVITYPLFYVIWIFANSQGYESALMRSIATLLCFILILYEKWPAKLKPYLPIYWYLTVMYCLPLFFSYLLLKNNFSSVESLNVLSALVLFILIVDTWAFSILLACGVILSCLIFKLNGGVFKFEENYTNILITYFSVILAGCIFAHKKEQIQHEKIQTIKTIGASIAHELRTPLRTISSAASGIKSYLPALIQTYNQAKTANLPAPNIEPTHLKTLSNACDDIEAETQAAFTVINMLLINVAQSSNISAENFKRQSITHCINEALRRYPFDIGERALVNYEPTHDFIFKGDELLTVHILFNLLKNALYQIKAANKGEIFIDTKLGSKYNELHFKDTAKGISAKVLPHIFDRFFTQTYHGTGTGLAFCKMVMEASGGKIFCNSVEGEFAEFVLYFPVLSSSALGGSDE